MEPTDEKPATPLPTPTGPLLVVVSLGKQQVTVYDGTTQIAQSPISSGTSSNPTPTGIFSILEKNRYHYSNLYGGAPMPFMQRITNSGVALHAGDLPGYPASHGCIRLPYSFARSLFGITGIGARVIVSDDDLTPSEFHSTRLIAPLPPDDLAQANPATRGATAEMAAGTQNDSNVGVTQVAAAMSERPRTRAMAAAARAAERQQLAANITSAEAAKAAAVAHVKAMTDAARAAKEAIRKARNEAGRFADAARRASRAADKAEEQFAELTGKMSKIEAGKLMRIEIDKIAAEEMLEERKVVELAALTRAAKALADKQAHVTKRAVAKAEEAEKTRRASLEGVEKANQAIADAKAALAAAEAIEARKDLPVSIFVNAKTGRLIAKLGFVPGHRRAGDHLGARRTARHPRLHRDGSHRPRTLDALERRVPQGRRVLSAAPPQAAPSRGRGLRAAGWRGCRRGTSTRSYRDPEGYRRTAGGAHEAGIIAHRLRLPPEPRDQQPHRVRHRTLAQPPSRGTTGIPLRVALSGRQLARRGLSRAA